MSFFIKEENVRAGNRGGRTLFNWNDIRLLNNKERESYLGVTQSIGFLDKGGKWRKRDWWQNNKNSNEEVDKQEILSEKERIKLEENRQFNETFNNMFGNNGNNKTNKNSKKEKLTVFEWSELFKKEANINPNDPKVFEFYEKDEHKRGLGMKTNISFKTNPYEKDTLENLGQIKGEGYENNNKENNFNNLNNFDGKDNDNSNNESNKELFDINNIDKNCYEHKHSGNGNYKEKKKEKINYSLPELMEMWKSGKIDKSELAGFVLGDDNNKNNIGRINKKDKKKKSKKEKKHKSKKSKKEKKSKSKSKNKRSSSRSLSRSRSFSRSRSLRSYSKSDNSYPNDIDNDNAIHNDYHRRKRSYSNRRYSRSISREKDNHRNKSRETERKNKK